MLDAGIDINATYQDGIIVLMYYCSWCGPESGHSSGCLSCSECIAYRSHLASMGLYDSRESKTEFCSVCALASKAPYSFQRWNEKMHNENFGRIVELLIHKGANVHARSPYSKIAWNFVKHKKCLSERLLDLLEVEEVLKH